jgi:4-hydroxy-2-oxoheptanedioate aldolase
MSAATHGRARLRDRLARAERVVGTFVKLPSLDVIDLAAAAGFDFVLVDLEHSQLSAAQAGDLARHAAAIDLPALVRVPAVDPALVNQMLEAGAAGVQLSMLSRAAQSAALRTATRYPPQGARSVSLLHPSADFGAAGLAGYLAAERRDPPLLVGQIETVTTQDPLPDLLDGLDVAFVGTTDLSVDIGLDVADAADRLRRRVAEVARSAEAAGAHLGGFTPSGADPEAFGLGSARYLVVGADAQLLRAGMDAALARLARPAGS